MSTSAFSSHGLAALGAQHTPLRQDATAQR
jgi:hypothetical protein